MESYVSLESPSPLTTVKVDYLKAASRSIFNRDVHSLARQFMPREDHDKRIVVINADVGCGAEALITTLTKYEESRNATCLHYSFASSYNQDVCATIRRIYPSLKRKGFNNHRMFVVFQDLCTTYTEAYEELCNLVLKLYEQGVFVIVYTSPEYAKHFSPLLSYATMLTAAQLNPQLPDELTGESCGVQRTFWQLTHHITDLYEAIDVDKSASVCVYDAHSSYVLALARVIEESFKRPYVRDYGSAYMAALMLGSGVLSDVETISSGASSVFRSRAFGSVPLLNVDDATKTFSCAGVCDDIVFAQVTKLIPNVCTEYRDVLWRCSALLAKQGHVIRSAKIVEMLLDPQTVQKVGRKPRKLHAAAARIPASSNDAYEDAQPNMPSNMPPNAQRAQLNPHAILLARPSDDLEMDIDTLTIQEHEYYKELYPYVSDYLIAGSVTVARRIYECMRKASYKSWPARAYCGVHMYTYEPAGTMKASIAFDGITRPTTALLRSRDALRATHHIRKVLVLGLTNYRSLQIHGEGSDYTVAANVIAYAMRELLQGKFTSTYEFLTEHVRDGLPANMLSYILTELYSVSAKLTVNDYTPASCKQYYDRLVTRDVNLSAPMLYISALHDIADMLMSGKALFLEGEHLVGVAHEQHDDTLEILFRVAQSVSLIYQHKYGQARALARKAARSANNINLTYLAQACAFIELCCTCELNGFVDTRLIEECPSFAVLTRLLAKWGIPRIAPLSKKQQKLEMEQLCSTENMAQVRDLVWAITLIRKGFKNLSRNVTGHIPFEWLGMLHPYVESRKSLISKREYNNLLEKITVGWDPSVTLYNYPAVRDGDKALSIASSPHSMLACTANDLLNDVIHSARESVDRTQLEQQSETALEKPMQPVYIHVFNRISVEDSECGVDTKKLYSRHAHNVLGLLALVSSHKVSRYNLISSIWGDCDFDYGMKRLYEAVSSLRGGIVRAQTTPIIIVEKQHGSIGLNGNEVVCDVDVFEKLARQLLSGQVRDDNVMSIGCRVLSIYGSGIDIDMSDTAGLFRSRCDEIRSLYTQVAMLVSKVALQTHHNLLATQAAQQAFSVSPYRDDVMMNLAEILSACNRASEIYGYFQMYRQQLLALGIRQTPRYVLDNVDECMQSAEITAHNDTLLAISVDESTDAINEKIELADLPSVAHSVLADKSIDDDIAAILIKRAHARRRLAEDLLADAPRTSGETAVIDKADVIDAADLIDAPHVADAMDDAGDGAYVGENVRREADGYPRTQACSSSDETIDDSQEIASA